MIDQSPNRKSTQDVAQLTVKVYADSILLGWTTNEVVVANVMNEIIKNRQKAK